MITELQPGYLRCKQLIHRADQLPQIAHLQYITAQWRVLWHIAVSVPHEWGFWIQPDGPRGAAAHQRENVETRVVVVIASITDDDESRLAVECIQIFLVEIVERPAEVGVVMSAGHTPQNGGNGFIRVGAVEVLRNRLKVVNERKSMRLANLSLQGI